MSAKLSMLSNTTALLIGCLYACVGFLLVMDGRFVTGVVIFCAGTFITGVGLRVWGFEQSEAGKENGENILHS
jgi:hypothetical protein